jgi:hypothetical protein
MRAEEFITEASYDAMIKKMQTTYPAYLQLIKDNLKKAKAIFKKDEKIVWWMKNVNKTIQEVENQTPGSNINDLNGEFESLEHFFGYKNDEIDNYVFGNKTYLQITDDLRSIETKIQKQQHLTNPVKQQPGDYVLFKFNNGSAWWWVDRAFCPEEGRSGKHCGNAVGQYETAQRILSFRSKDNHVILTFILEPNGYLGEMKARGNTKPDEKYHPYIMQLLLWDKIQGIKGAGWGPEFNFSVFDLNDNYLTQLKEQKPVIISTQISATPREFLKAPNIIKNDPTFQNVAIETYPAIKHFIRDGKVDDSTKSWENAINEDPSIVVYGPNTVSNYNEKVVAALLNDKRLLPSVPRSILKNMDIMSKVISESPHHLRYVVPEQFRTRELCMIALSNNGSIKDVPESILDRDMAIIAINSSNNIDQDTIDEMNEDEYNDWRGAPIYVYNDLPDNIKHDHEVIVAAIKQNAAIWMVSLTDDEFKKYEDFVLKNISIKDIIYEVDMWNDITSSHYYDNYRSRYNYLYSKLVIENRSFMDIPSYVLFNPDFYEPAVNGITNKDELLENVKAILERNIAGIPLALYVAETKHIITIQEIINIAQEDNGFIWPYFPEDHHDFKTFKLIFDSFINKPYRPFSFSKQYHVKIALENVFDMPISQDLKMKCAKYIYSKFPTAVPHDIINILPKDIKKVNPDDYEDYDLTSFKEHLDNLTRSLQE